MSAKTFWHSGLININATFLNSPAPFTLPCKSPDTSSTFIAEPHYFVSGCNVTKKVEKLIRCKYFCEAAFVNISALLPEHIVTFHTPIQKGNAVELMVNEQ